MIEAKTGLIHTVAGDGAAGDPKNVGDGGLAAAAHVNMPSDVAIDRANGDVYVADMYHNRVRRIDAKTHIISTVAGTGEWGFAGDGIPAAQAKLAGPAGIAIVDQPNGKVTIFIADTNNGIVRAVGPDGLIHDLRSSSVPLETPTRVAFVNNGPHRGRLWVADPDGNALVSLQIQAIAPNLVPPVRPTTPARRVGG